MRRCGITASNVVPVSTRSPPITIGMWTRSPDICREPLLELRPLGRPGRVALDRLVDRGGRTEDAGGAHSGDCILDGVRVTRHPYDVPGWGVGEVWVRDGVVIQHELASESLRREHEAAAERGDDVACCSWAVRPQGSGAGAGGDAGPARLDAPSSVSPNGGARRPARTLPAERVTRSCRLRAGSVPAVRGAPRAACRRPTTTSRSSSTGRRRCSSEFAAAARAIPWGEVVSYGELAALAGRPGAARAAGSFCADNRFSLIIPCHRIVAANGIGGYGSAGLGLKRRLLALEGVHL